MIATRRIGCPGAGRDLRERAHRRVGPYRPFLRIGTGRSVVLGFAQLIEVSVIHFS